MRVIMKYRKKGENMNKNIELTSLINDSILDSIFKEKEESLYYQNKYDKEKIKEIVSNLLSNAIKYTNEGTITLSFKCEAINKNKLKLFINCQDSGVGIAKSDIDKIFNKFERLGNNDSNIEGAGLGLVITNALIELMGGKIEVDSQVNKGSIFKVELLQKNFNNEDIIDKEIETAYEEDFSATYVFDSKTKEEYVIKNGTRKNK